jgi:hypothetical protein
MRRKREQDEALDLLVGAEAIALFLFGDDDPKTRRKVYALDKEAYGLFQMGKLWCARKSTIRQRIAAREGRA